MSSSTSDVGRARILAFVKVLLTLLASWWIVQALGLRMDDLRAAGPELADFDLPLLLASVVVLLAGYAISAVLWGVMVRDLGGPWIGLLPSARLFMLANLGRYIPGKIWQLASLALLGRERGVAPATGAAAAALGQGMGLVGAGLVGVLVLPELEPVGGISPTAWLAIGVGGALLVTAPPTLRLLLRLWYGLTRQPEAGAPRLTWGFGPRWIVAYVFNWAVYASSFVLLVMSMQEVTSFLYVGASFAAAYLVGYLILFAPAGLGVRDGLLTALLTPQFGAPAALAIAIVARVWTTGVELVAALGFAFAVPSAAGGSRDSDAE